MNGIQAPWVGLTDEEWEEILNYRHGYDEDEEDRAYDRYAEEL